MGTQSHSLGSLSIIVPGRALKISAAARIVSGKATHPATLAINRLLHRLGDVFLSLHRPQPHLGNTQAVDRFYLEY